MVQHFIRTNAEQNVLKFCVKSLSRFREIGMKPKEASFCDNSVSVPTTAEMTTRCLRNVRIL